MSGPEDKDSANSSRRPTPPRAPVLPRPIERRIDLARLFLLWERLWAGIWPAIVLTGFFIALALLGAASGLPLALHWAGLAVFTLMLAIALWNGLKGFRWPDRDAALHHLEIASGLTHQPLAAYEDLPAEGSGDPALWRAHQRWIATRLKKLKLGFVAPGIIRRDPYALRAIVALLLVIGLVGTSPGRLQRVADAFFPGAGATRTFTIEAWITPPAYTGEPPIYLERSETAPTGTGGTLDHKTASVDDVIKVPVGSTLSLRAHGLRNPPALNTNDEDHSHPTPLETLGDNNFTIDTKITKSSEFALTEGGRLLRGWTVEVIADNPPKIRFTKPLQQTASGSLHFAYAVSDDYGVTGATARITLAEPPHATNAEPDIGGLSAADVARRKISDLFRQTRAIPKITPPTITLPLKSTHPKDENGDTYIDLTSHPWAGLPVHITLVAKDDVGQMGESESVAMTLPARHFTKPLAAATIEQRRMLAFNPMATTRVARVLDDLTMDGSTYIDDTTTYLALRAAYWRLLVARRDSDLNGIFDLLWSIALRIEDGDLSLAESDLRRARDALTKALQSGANDDEISRLLDEMRSAFQRYMEALAAKTGNNPDQAMIDKFAPRNGQTIDRDQLEKMLGQIGDLARNGSREEAARLLKQMQAIMENMQTPDQQSAMTAEEKAMAGAVDKMSGLIDQQRKLMDKTFRAGVKGHEKGDKGPPDKELKALRDEQEGLRNQLEAAIEELQKTNPDIPDALAKADQHMQNAEKRLGNGRTDRATTAQGQAIKGMREGTQGLVDKLAKSMMGRGGRPNPQARGGENKDPLGRGGNPTTTRDGNVPGEIDRQTARDIIEELRRRASELGRPKIELEYLDRLLDRF